MCKKVNRHAHCDTLRKLVLHQKVKGGDCLQNTVIMTLEIHVRHGSTLVMRNVRWVVTSRNVCDPLLGRPTLLALGLNLMDILASAADRLNGETDLSALHYEITEPSEGKVATLTDEAVFHRDKGVDDFADDE